jgi:hypothetical protein
MKIKLNFKHIAKIVICVALSFPAFGQETPPNSVSTEPVVTAMPKQFAAGLSTGMSGLFGLDAAMNINRYFNARLAFQYLGYHYANPTFQPTFIESIKNQQFDLDARVRLSNLSVLGEYKPFQGGKFRIIAGLGYFFNNDIAIKGVANKDYLFNDVVFEPAEIGSMTTTWSYKSKISPYVGLAFGRAVPKKRFGFGVELGSYYKGAPQIDIKATGALRENERNGPILTNNFSTVTRYRFMPNIAMRLSYKIN